MWLGVGSVRRSAPSTLLWENYMRHTSVQPWPGDLPPPQQTILQLSAEGQKTTLKAGGHMP